MLGQVRIPIEKVVESRYIDEWYILEPDMDEALKELDLVKNKFSLMDEKFGDVRLTLSLSVSFWFIGISWYKIYLIFPNLEIPCFAVGPLWGPDSAAIDGPLGLRADLGKDRREGASRQGGEYGCPYLRS